MVKSTALLCLLISSTSFGMDSGLNKYENAGQLGRAKLAFRIRDNIMKKTEFLDLFAELLEAEKGSLKGSEKLSSLSGWDSLAVVGFIGLVDKHFQATVDAEAIGKAVTVDDLVALLWPKIKG